MPIEVDNVFRRKGLEQNRPIIMASLRRNFFPSPESDFPEKPLQNGYARIPAEPINGVETAFPQAGSDTSLTEEGGSTGGIAMALRIGCVVRDQAILACLLLVCLVWLSPTPTLAQAHFSLSDLCQDSPPDLWRVRADYLLWWTKGNSLPPLVTSSPEGTPREMAGVLGTPGVEILFGDHSIDNQVRSGGRWTLSRWLDDQSQIAVEGTFLYIADDRRTGDFSANQFAEPILARPFMNARNNNQEDSQLVAFPNVLDGRIDVASSSEIYSAELLARWTSHQGSRGQLDWLAGYRHFHFGESLNVRERLTSVEIGGLVPLGTQFDLSDRFSTGNDFHGGQLGLALEFWHDIFSWELSAKAALGNLRRQSRIRGETTTQLPPLDPRTTQGALLALPTNIGTYSDNRFAVLPEFGINGTVLLTGRLSLVCGYSLILLNDVARTGNQIDRTVNTSQIGNKPLDGPARPAARLAGSDLWIQGLNIGLDYRW